MKSKICLCNGAVLRKDLTRFAPLMLLESFFLLLMGYAYWVSEVDMNADYTSYIEPGLLFSAFGAMMALVSSVVLFTYLTKKKECDAMHALPVRRETLLLTHALAGLIQFVVPFAVLYIFLPGTKGWPWQMGLSLSSWLFAFGSMTLCMMLAGSRIGAVLLYWVIGDLPSIVYSLLSTVYVPLLPGVYMEPAEEITLSPLSLIAEIVEYGGLGKYEWISMVIYGLLGIAMLALALVLYRRRKLERAGDFLAVKWLEPVVSWIVAIYLGCGLVNFAQMLEVNMLMPMILGLTVGYFGSRMAFARSVKVFQKKGLLGFVLLVVLMIGSVNVVTMDPLGIVKRVPAAEEIKTVSISDNDFSYYDYRLIGGYTTADPDEVEGLRTIHQMLIDAGAVTSKNSLYYYGNDRFFLTYELKNGSTVRRAYIVEDEAVQDRISYFLSQPENLTGTADLEELLKNANDLRAWNMGTGHQTIHLRREFFEVFLADCEKGNMYAVPAEKISTWDVSFLMNVDGEDQYVSIDIPVAAEDTLAWLEEHLGAPG